MRKRTSGGLAGYLGALIGLGSMALAACGGSPADLGPAPGIISTTPASGASGVLPTASILVTWDQPMTPSAGAITLNGLTQGYARRWDAAATTLTIDPTNRLALGSAVSVTLAGFTSAAGAAQEGTYSLSFTVEPAAPCAADIRRPRVTSPVTPIVLPPGSTSHSYQLTFDEPVSGVAESVTLDTLSGAPGAVVAVTGTGAEYTAAISGLADGGLYRLTIGFGIFDGCSNPLWQSAAVRLSVALRPDETAPSVLSATPPEGAVDVHPLAPEVRLVFSESMATGVGLATLGGGPGSLGPPVWSQTSVPNDTLTLPLLGPLAVQTAYALTLSGYRDPSGNPLDGAPVLGDGVLDFSTALLPAVTGSTPVEGAACVPTGQATLSLRFSMSMDTGLGSAVLSGGPQTLSGASWSTTTLTNDTLTLTVSGGPLAPAQAYRVTLSGFASASGGGLYGGSYLGDGALDFVTAPLPGDRCTACGPAYVLDSLDADALSDGWSWSLAAGAVAQADHSFTCDPSSGADGVIALDKAATDSLLSILVEQTALGDSVAVELAPACAGIGTLACRSQAGVRSQQLELFDLPAGRYWLWLGNGVSAGAFRGAQVVVRELALAAGESCGTALPLSVGINSLSPPASAWRAADPACIPTGDLVWYRFTMSGANNLLDLIGDQAEPLAVFNRATMQPLACGADATNLATLALPAGTSVCIALAAATAMTSLVVSESIDPTPHGEDCSDPATLVSASASGGGWEWDFDPADYSWADHYFAPCDLTTGGDVVVEYRKVSDSSLLLIEADQTAYTTASGLALQVLGSDCWAGSSLACQASPTLDQLTQVLAAPAGTYYVWLGNSAGGAFNGAELRIEEAVPGPGESCAQAEPLTVGPNDLSGQTPSGLRAASPSCIPSGDLNWYSFTLGGANNQLGLLADTAAPLSLFDRASGVELGCWTDLSGAGVTRTLAAGSSVCIAVQAFTAIETLTVSQAQALTCDLALISQGTELAAITTVLDSLPGLSYTHYSNDYGTRTADPLFLAGQTRIIWYKHDRTISAQELGAMEAWLQAGGRLLVTGYDSLGNPADTNLASLVRSTTTGDGPFQTGLTVLDGSHPISAGPYGSLSTGATLSAATTDHDSATPDALQGGVAVVGLTATSYAKIMATEIGASGLVVYWNGNEEAFDWSGVGGTQPALQNLFKNAVHQLCWP